MHPLRLHIRRRVWFVGHGVTHRRHIGRTATFMVPCALALAATGCGARLAVPVDVCTATDELRVEGRSYMSGSVFVKEDFTIGDYAVTDVSHAPGDSIRYPTFAGFEAESRSAVTFTVHGAQASLRGSCVEDRTDSETDMNRLKVHRRVGRYACGCGDAASPAVSMAIGLPAPGLAIEGTMTLNGATYTVKGLYGLEGAGPSTSPTGYRIDGARGVVGAVDVLGGGRAWIAKSIDDAARAPVVCMIAGLLFYKAPDSGAPPASP